MTNPNPTPTSGAADLPAIISGALFDFAGFLTTLDKSRAVTFSGAHEAGPAVTLLQEWSTKRGLNLDEADVSGWSSALTAQAISKAPDHVAESGNMVVQAISAEPAGAGYAELPDAKTLGEAVAAWIGVETRGAHNWVDTTVDRLGFAVRSVVGDMLRASHGQASSQAGEYPALVCDYCGALTPDPWHSSGMLHGKMSKHIHSCDACAAPVDAAVQQDAARWEFRWLNPANNLHVAPSDLGWKTVNSKGMRSEKEVLEDLKTYRYQGKPVYELRPLFATRALQKPEIRCPVRLANGGDCPRHNLQCGWPDCNKETK